MFRFSNSLTNKLENQSQGWSEKLQGETKKIKIQLSSYTSIEGVDPAAVPGSGLKRKVSFPMRNNAFTQKQIMSQGAICQNETS